MRPYYLFLVLLTHTPSSQDLVPNGRFEEELQPPCFYIHWLNDNISNYTTYWSTPTLASPDYFSHTDTCYPVPQTMEGFSETHSGLRMAGIITFSIFFSGSQACPNDYSEYLQVQLLEPLVPGIPYRLSASFKLSPKSAYTCDAIGFAFTTTPISHALHCPLDIVPDITIDQHIISEWTQIDTTFTATTSAQYLTIGRFIPYSDIECIFLGGEYHRSYYFIDDVSLIPLLPTGVHQVDQVRLTTLINPVHDELLFTSNVKLYGKKIEIFSLTGALIKHGVISADDPTVSFDVHDLPPGGYIARVMDQGTLFFLKQ